MNSYSLYRLSTNVKLLTAYTANEILSYLNDEDLSDYYVESNAIKLTANEFVAKYNRGKV